MILSSENVDPETMLDIMRRIKVEARKERGETVETGEQAETSNGSGGNHAHPARPMEQPSRNQSAHVAREPHRASDHVPRPPLARRPVRIPARASLSARPEDRLTDSGPVRGRRMTQAPQPPSRRRRRVTLAAIFVLSAGGLLLSVGIADVGAKPGPETHVQEIRVHTSPIQIEVPDPMLPKDPRLPRGLGRRAGVETPPLRTADFRAAGNRN